MHRAKVLIVGGSGYFGRLLVDDLRRHAQCDLVVASRKPLQSKPFQTVVVDLDDPASLADALHGIQVAICAAGPFQKLPLTLAEMCIERGIHYIDLADDRAFVHKVRSLAAASPKQEAAVCTGWSTVSALSGALVQIGAAGMNKLDSIYIAMAPGNRGARQTATVASLLHSVGRRLQILRDGRWCQVTGWSEPRNFVFPVPVGTRSGYLVDVPDHEIFPDLFGARTVEFRAGSELSMLNRCLSLLRRTGRSWVRWAPVLQRVSAALSWIGHDYGAVGVEVADAFRRRRVTVVADSAGERIAVMPASIMIAKLSSGASYKGLVSPALWIGRDELQHECEKRALRLTVEEL